MQQNIQFEEALVKLYSTLLNAKGRSAFALTRNKSRLANVQTLAERQASSGCNTRVKLIIMQLLVSVRLSKCRSS